MNEFIAYCGLDCKACEARLATVNNDDALRRRENAFLRFAVPYPAMRYEQTNGDVRQLSGNEFM